MTRKKIKSKKLKMFVNKENLLIFSIFLGISLLSFGVYLVGNHNSYGSIILTTGGGVFYVSIIVFVLLFA